jgi:hypothetical protein
MKDLDNITWWYWLDDRDYDDDIPLLPVQNSDIFIWTTGCRRYDPDTKEIIHYCSTECRILSYGPPCTHYLGGYQDRLLGGPLGLPDLRCTAPVGVKHKDYGGVLG